MTATFRILAGAAPDGVDAVGGERQGIVRAFAHVINNGFVLLADQPVDTITVGESNRAISPVAC